MTLLSSVFDVWSIQHFLSGISIGPGKKRRIKTVKNEAGSGLLVVGALAYLWEIIEYYLEKGLLGARVKDWLHGVELWPNRIISDPLLMIVGYIIAKKYPRCIWPVRGVFLTWFMVHAFVFPHSMYLHEIF